MLIETVWFDIFVYELRFANFCKALQKFLLDENAHLNLHNTVLSVGSI